LLDFTPPLDRVDVWTLRTDGGLDVPLCALERLLAGDELRRANRFRFDHLRRDYVLSRGCLRLLCGRYLRAEPHSLILSYTGNGKPELESDCKLRFNLSHSGGLTVFAFAWGLELGVDVERVRELKDLEDISRRFFCSEEADEVLAAPALDRTRIFYNCWTRKESFIKATGNGLSTPLHSFQVASGSEATVRVIHVNFDADEGSRWTLQSLDLQNPYVGALCYRAPALPVRVRAVPQFSDLFKTN
jgi:4'-phosphopantetheinyl transferase